MADIKAIQDQVQERLAELEERIEQLSTEFEQLQAIAGMLANTNGGTTASTSRTSSRSRRSPAKRESARPTRSADTGPKPSGGNRARQALELIGAHPGLTAAELATSMGMKRNYLYRVLPALEKDGKITKQGKGYHPAGDRAAVAA